MGALKLSKILLKFACFGHCWNSYVCQMSWCQGPSMLPNFHMNGLVGVEHISYYFRPPEIGDVVISMSPAVPGRSVLKRVIGLPGDNICEDPTKAQKDRRFVNVPEGHVWLGGDNMSNSTDSRDYGPVPIALIRGRVFAKIWPCPEILKKNFMQIE